MCEVLADLLNTNLSNGTNNEDMSEESFIMARLLDFNASQHDENTAVAMVLEGLLAVRNKFKNRAFEMADKLDAVIAEHAEEKRVHEQRTADLLEKYEQKCAMYEQLFDELVKKNNAKVAASFRTKEALRHINEQIRKVLTEMGKTGEQEQLILDCISLTDDNEAEDEVTNNDDEHDDDEGSNDDGDGQKNAEMETPALENQNDGLAEQNGNDDGDTEMAEQLPAENEDDAKNDKENVQPLASNEDATAEFQPPQSSSTPVLVAASVSSVAPVATSSTSSVVFVKPAPVAQPNANAIENGTVAIKVEKDSFRKQCFWCEESFIKDSSLRNHLKSDHGMVLLPEKRKKKDTDQEKDEPGKFVRPIQSIKRKRSSFGSTSSIAMADQNDDIENQDAAPQPDPKRKYAKLMSEPLRRSNSRV